MRYCTWKKFNFDHAIFVFHAVLLNPKSKAFLFFFFRTTAALHSSQSRDSAENISKDTLTSIERGHKWQCQVSFRIKLRTGIRHLHVLHVLRCDFVVAIAVHKSWFTHRVVSLLSLFGMLELSPQQGRKFIFYFAKKNTVLRAINPNIRFARATMYFWYQFALSPKW